MSYKVMNTITKSQMKTPKSDSVVEGDANPSRHRNYKALDVGERESLQGFNIIHGTLSKLLHGESTLINVFKASSDHI